MDTDTYPDGEILRRKRVLLGLSQQQVADRSNIALRQYQRLEYGERSLARTSMRIGLAVCEVLQTDPYDIVFREPY